jgi:hypothetical protein
VPVLVSQSAVDMELAAGLDVAFSYNVVRHQLRTLVFN